MYDACGCQATRHCPKMAQLTSSDGGAECRGRRQGLTAVRRPCHFPVKKRLENPNQVSSLNFAEGKVQGEAQRNENPSYRTVLMRYGTKSKYFSTKELSIVYSKVKQNVVI
ncbi:unnamed protein product [Arctia plantaginis]|uniref:Uncharacterized protein n=1 Tax=Arctia plantaginis TaxID=874455 RepID=A0A8S1A328_ARCPL|nr:unnamed protein product [Arctia plantaginis]